MLQRLRQLPLARQLRRIVRRPRTIQVGVGAGLRIDLAGADLAYGHGDRELPVQQALARHIRPGNVVYDIGANIGFFTILAAQLAAPQGHVYAFEPVPANVEAIRHNLRLNQQANGTIFPVAVADQSGTASFTLTRHIGGAVLSSSGTPPDATSTVVVQTISIDDGLHQGLIRAPAVVKIDVEGAELLVLRGMRKTLATHRPVVIFEVDAGDQDALQARWEACSALLTTHSYGVEKLEDSYPGGAWHVAHGVAVPNA